ncbi:hypothetical protein RYX36_034773 [Vicia faba]
MHVQLGRARRRTDTQDIELAMDMMVVFSDEDDHNAYRAIIERLTKKLELHSVKDLEVETVVVGYLARERKGHQEESTQKIIGLLNQYKRIACMEETGVVIDDDPVMPNKMFGRSTSFNIPHEFICPITLESHSSSKKIIFPTYMHDAKKTNFTHFLVIVCVCFRQRESIEKWFKSNHNSFQKTRQPLEHLQLAPNCALKNLIIERYDKNNFKHPKICTSCH